MARKAKNPPRFPDARGGRTKSVGYAYVGRYRDGTLGWVMPRFLSTERDRADARHIDRDDPELFRPATFVLCRITVEEIPGRRKIHLKEKRRG